MGDAPRTLFVSCASQFKHMKVLPVPLKVTDLGPIKYVYTCPHGAFERQDVYGVTDLYCQLSYSTYEVRRPEAPNNDPGKVHDKKIIMSFFVALEASQKDKTRYSHQP